MQTANVPNILMDFIRKSFLDGDPRGELDETSPLLAWGVLNSLNTATLLSFLRDELNVYVPPARINHENFQDIRSISRLVNELLADSDQITAAQTKRDLS